MDHPLPRANYGFNNPRCEQQKASCITSAKIILGSKKFFFVAGRCMRVAFYEILGLQLTFGSSHATLPFATHTRLPHAPRRGDARTTHARRRSRLCRTCSGEHARRKNVRRVPLRFARDPRSLAQNRRDAL